MHEGNITPLPAYLLDAIKKCNVFFVENERTARRFLKLLWKEMMIDDYEWHTMKEVTLPVINDFKNALRAGKSIGIISEAGCPGVADPGQKLVLMAQELNVPVRPLVGPSSILLALMGSGMNGQQFQFIGYLPIDSTLRIQAIKSIEGESKQKNCTQIFIETPYRNNQLAETLVRTCRTDTLLCIAAELTSDQEFIKTKRIEDWKKSLPDLHKRTTIFLLLAG
ncbi:MAG TPA: SAM-dependent methyltransferase [Chitinophagaceae bacterium]|nr:SAM-dependent methyltransferase [Chitinophagaceae bacterium]